MLVNSSFQGDLFIHTALHQIRLVFLAKYLLYHLYLICRGVSVDEKGYIYVADSGNNRIQIFNPDGTFLRCFGRWGQVNIFQTFRFSIFSMQYSF